VADQDLQLSGHAAYCARCGHALVVQTVDGRARAVCRNCGYVAYRNPVPAAGVVVVEGGRVLMVQRKFEPRVGEWTLPAGFVEYDEHVEECAVRETLEETGLNVELTRLFGAYMAMDDPRVQVVLLLYLARRTGGELRAGDDASDAGYFPIESLPGRIAFKAHEQALSDLRRMLGA
jgi:ADP-ribose pyrophosphatase YjhB (NUDIX family)